eukprot:gene14004-19939_t
MAALDASLKPSGGIGGIRAAITGQRPILGDDCPPLSPIGWDIRVAVERPKDMIQ